MPSLPAFDTIDSLTALETHYGPAVPAALRKVAPHLTPCYHRWIMAARFVVLTSVGPQGTDGSPRGDRDPVVQIADPQTILLPDWRGNNRLDSLRNIVEDGRVSLMFMVPGCANVVRINGHAVLTADQGLRDRFERQGKHPATVIVITIAEIYFQCAKAIMRSDLWAGSESGSESGADSGTGLDTGLDAGLPTAGDFIAESQTGFDGAAYDQGYAEYAAERMW